MGEVVFDVRHGFVVDDGAIGVVDGAITAATEMRQWWRDDSELGAVNTADLDLTLRVGEFQYSGFPFPGVGGTQRKS